MLQIPELEQWAKTQLDPDDPHVWEPLRAPDDLSFRYIDGEFVPEDTEDVKGKTKDSKNYQIPPFGRPFVIVREFEWEVVEMDRFSDSVKLGLKVYYKFAVEGRLGIVPIEIPPLANKVNKTVEIGTYPLHDVDSNEDGNEDSGTGGDGGGGSNDNEDPDEPYEDEEASYDSSDDVEWYDGEDDYYVGIGEIEVLGVVDDDDYYYCYYYEEDDDGYYYNPI